MELLTIKQAYAATVLFLDLYYQHTKSEDVAIVLSGMKLLPDGMSVDPAAWEDWIECVQRVQTATQTPDEWQSFEDTYLALRLTHREDM